MRAFRGMYTAILLAVMLSKGTPVRAVEGLVIVEGRPGCTVHALHGDPARPVVVCR
jgi:hypothetical protein